MKDFSKILNDKRLIKTIQYVLISLFIVLVGLDIYLALDKIDDNTISMVILNNTDNGLFVLTYFWGAIAANLFFTTRQLPLVSPVVGSIILVALSFLIPLFDLEPKLNAYLVDHNYGLSVYSISMSLGFLMAYIFWRQQADNNEIESDVLDL